MDVKCDVLLTVPGLVHGFGTQREPIPRGIQPDWDRGVPQWKQVHGVGVVRVETNNQTCGNVDALYTFQPKIPIAIMTADCVPILMARRDGQAVAAVHAGWRGARAHIINEVWARLKQDGESPADWVAAIGPAIGPCCYEVSEELADDFRQEFANLGEGLAVPAFRKLDLPAIQAAVLTQLGLTAVENLRICTHCSNDPVFSSYRRDHSKDRQYSVAMLTR